MAQIAVILIFIGASAGWIWVLLRADRGAKEPVGALWLAAAYGLLALVLAVAIESLFIKGSSEDVTVAKLGLLPTLLATLGVGFAEEFAKFLPMAWHVHAKRYFNEYTDGIIYFGLVGLTFGLLENIVYTIGYDAGTGLVRVLLDLFFHASTTGIIGFYFVRAKLQGTSLRPVAGALLGLGLVHGLYDFLLSSGQDYLAILAILITLGLQFALIYFYRLAIRLDQQKGLSSVGTNIFCRSCGQLNQHHTLYCQHCGHLA
jgi:RsiW-degrading membrane proteinase PrsW (M82 family)